MDKRRLYIRQLLRNYKQSFSPYSYTVNYQIGNDKQHKLFNHNDGIDFVINYISELEDKLDELKDIERIIKVARSESYGN